jgi:hypothetical protein
LGVASLLEGNVLSDGGAMRIGVELVDGGNGFSRWSKRFEVSVSNIIKVQEEVQLVGFGAFSFPILLVAVAWKWLRSEPIDSQGVKVFGSVVLLLAVCTAFGLGPEWRPFAGTIAAGGWRAFYWRTCCCRPRIRQARR